MIIKDPSTCRAMNVNDEGRAEISAVTRTAEMHTNQVHGEAYAIPFAVNPDGADDCFFYIKNNSDIDMIIKGVWYTLSDADELYFKVGESGTAVATNGTDMTSYIANLNAGSGNIADVTCYSNTADGAVDITGLSGGRTIDKLWVVAAADNKFFNFEQDVILPKNQTFSIYAVGGDALVRGTVMIHFHNKNV
jgi:hypothetical protein